MSIASEITRLQNIKAAIRQALVNKGIAAASSHDMADFAADIGNIATGATLQSKSVTPEASQITVTPDSGYDGLSQVIVAATPLETKSVTPSASAQTVTPSSGKVGLSQVNVAAAPLETKSVTPSASQQIITPSSGKIGMSRVTVAGDADLIASNIKSGVNIFGIAGSYVPTNVPINGSLIEVTCSSNIDTVTATVNGNTYTAYKSGNKAYITIPYTDTTVARTCTLRGYSSGTQIKTNSLSMTAGIGYYTISLIATEYLYKDGVWYGVTNPTWSYSTMDTNANVTEYSDRIVIRKGLQYSTTFTLSPTFDMDGHTNFEIEYSISNGTFRTGTYGCYAQMAQGSSYVRAYIPTGTVVSNETMTSTDGTTAFTNATLSFALTLDNGTYGNFTIHSIKLI
mgnify:CR=1 FL=1